MLPEFQSSPMLDYNRPEAEAGMREALERVRSKFGTTVPLVIGGLIAIGLWLWMAWANGKGRSWARVVSAVFFGINTLDLLISLFMVHAVATLIIGVAIWLVGLGAIALLYGKESGPFYKQQSATAHQ